MLSYHWAPPLSFTEGDSLSFQKINYQILSLLGLVVWFKWETPEWCKGSSAHCEPTKSFYIEDIKGKSKMWVVTRKLGVAGTVPYEHQSSLVGYTFLVHFKNNPSGHKHIKIGAHISITVLIRKKQTETRSHKWFKDACYSLALIIYWSQ